MQDSNPGIDAEKDDTRTRLISADDREATIRIDTPVSEQTPAPAPDKGTPRRRNAWIYIVIALIVIAAGAVAAFLLLGDDKNDSNSSLTVESDEVPGVNDDDIDNFLNTAMNARYDKSDDESLTAVADSSCVAVADSAAAVW